MSSARQFFEFISYSVVHRLVNIRSDPPGTTLQIECGVPDSKFDFDVRLVQLPRWELLGEVCRLAGGAILPYLPDGPTHAGWNHELGKLSLRLYLVSITGKWQTIASSACSNAHHLSIRRRVKRTRIQVPPCCDTQLATRGYLGAH